MKRIRRPDKTRKENWFTRVPGADAGSGRDDAKVSMGVKIAVAAVFAAGFLYFLVGPGSGDGKDAGIPDTELESVAPEPYDDNAPAAEPVADTGNTAPFHRNPADEMPLSGGYDAGIPGRVALAGPSGGDALLVYVPAGYSAKKYARSVKLMPPGMDGSVQGNEALSVGWDNVPMMDELLSSGYADARDKYKPGEFDRYDYSVVDRYMYKSSDDGTSEVLVVRQSVAYAGDGARDYEYWRIVVAEQAGNRAWPVMSLAGDRLGSVLSMRYPDVPSLARAVFVPADGEPEWDPDSYEDPYGNETGNDDTGQDGETVSEDGVPDVSGIDGSE